MIVLVRYAPNKRTQPSKSSGNVWEQKEIVARRERPNWGLA